MSKLVVATLWLLVGLSLAVFGAAASVGNVTPLSPRLIPVWQSEFASAGADLHELDADAGGRPHVVTIRPGPDQLTHAFRADGSWRRSDVAPVTQSADFTFDLVADAYLANGVTLALAYIDLARDSSFYVTKEWDGWHSEKFGPAVRLVRFVGVEGWLVGVMGDQLMLWESRDLEPVPIGEPDPYIWSVATGHGPLDSPDDLLTIITSGATGSHLLSFDLASTGPPLWEESDLPFPNVIDVAVGPDREPVLLVTEAEEIDPGHPPRTLVRLLLAERVGGQWSTTPLAEGINWLVSAEVIAYDGTLHIAYRDPDGLPRYHRREPDGTWRAERLDAPTVGKVSLALNSASEVFLGQSDGESLRVWTRRLQAFENVIYLPLALQ